MSLTAERAGNIRFGRGLLEKAIDTAEGLHEPWLRASALEDLATMLLFRGYEEKALELALRSPSAESEKKVRARWVIREAEAGRLEQAHWDSPRAS